MLKLTVGLALVTLVTCSLCPNNEVCEEGQSCCQDPTGGFSCCPFHHGECCEDHLHCCPEGMMCSVKNLTCSNATHTQPLADRIPSKRPDLPKSFRMIFSLPASESDIICPDGSFCPAEFSCLMMSSSYGCCPVTQGRACSDGKHCCPKDHECSTDSSVCVQRKEKVQTVLCGNGTSECPADTTCCQTEDSRWACCPMPKAVCCEDKIHCCPEDSVCDVKASKCISSTNHDLPMWDKFPARLRAAWEDHKSAKKRPEPQHTTTTGTTSTIPDVQTTTLPAELPGVSSVSSDVPCNDTAACPDGNTCCKTKDGGWACCPLPEAVCCDDFIHCCPHGKKCDSTSSSCVDSSGSVPWLEKMLVRPIIKQKVAVTQVSSVHSDVPCNDTAACPDGNTCCKTKDGGWACCPLPEAVCCDDFIHCCPHGKKCDSTSSSCVDSSGSVPWLEKLPVRPIIKQKVAVTQVSSVQSNVPCNDTAACPDGSTCCKTKDGGWACCPLPEAVCCDDFIHCCPHGKKCDTTTASCVDSSGSLPWVEKVPVRPVSRQKVAVTQVSSVHSDVSCNDTATCPDGNTCCKTKDGEWACCPLPEAVCCEDFIHCCPLGKKCNLAAMTCEDPSCTGEPWVKHMPVQSTTTPNVIGKQKSDVPCNETAACPDGNTCCKTKDGGWACCPLPEAVCCDDFIHCCPHGKKCDTTSSSCIDSSGSVPWLEKMPVRPVTKQKAPVTQVSSVHSDVPCNETAACPDGNTCCKTKDGGWACCPLPEAVCCDDFIHCCPHGKKCDSTSSSCIDSSGSVPWLEKMPVRPVTKQKAPVTQVSSVHSDVPCNETAACPDGNTCCKTKDGGWACCPLPEAVCCDDFIHCCPHGKKCDTATAACVDSSGSVPWLEKGPVRPISRQKVAVTKVSSVHSDVPCNDTAACPDGNTCCKTKEGGWACCPLPEAVCCDDFIHCCPHGKKCDTATSACVDSSGSVPWLEKGPVRPIRRQKVAVTQASTGKVNCNSDHACPESSTCCKNTDGSFSCCPFPQAVCCKDKFHCCPQGTSCDFVTLTCKTSNTSVPMSAINSKEEQRQHEEVKVTVGKPNSRVPCDAQTSCPDYTTCCLIAKTRKWGCCPLPNAVCCANGEHCCPAHYKCNVSSVSCIKGDVVIPWYSKIAAKSTPAPRLDLGAVKCNEQLSCSADSTCCHLSKNEWGCCPFPEAVCCPDQKHCCPEGYRCDLRRRSCVKSTRLYVEITQLTSIRNKKQHPSVSVKDIQCGGGYSCQDGETCCPTSQTTWGCCPSPKAECCADMQHCCPAGYKCGPGGTCTSAGDFDWNNWLNWKMFFTKKKRAIAL